MHRTVTAVRSATMSCVCFPGVVDGYTYNQIIAETFKTCIYTPLDYAGFTIGWVSIGLWLVALFPQLWENYRLKKTEALSFWFAFQLLLGDVTNLAGCIVTQQLPTQTYVAGYFCFVDLFLLWQYYLYRQPKMRQVVRLSMDSESEQTHASSPLLAVQTVLVVAAVCLRFSGPLNLLDAGSARELLSSSPPLCNQNQPLPRAAFYSGTVIDWMSGILYLCARIPQILINYERKHVEGLAMGLFIISVLGNVTYGLSIILLLPKLDTGFFAFTLAFIVGALGTVSFDIVILIQFFLYKNNSHVSIAEE